MKNSYTNQRLSKRIKKHIGQFLDEENITNIEGGMYYERIKR